MTDAFRDSLRQMIEAEVKKGFLPDAGVTPPISIPQPDTSKGGSPSSDNSSGSSKTSDQIGGNNAQ
jgi:hypothetical protein